MYFSASYFFLLTTGLVAGVTASPAASPDVSSRADTFTGDATFYDPNGGFGACGSPLQNGDFIVALSESQYAGGSRCGQRIGVDFNGNHIDVTVQDLCPGCGPNDIDLSEGAFSALAPTDLGRIQVAWGFE